MVDDGLKPDKFQWAIRLQFGIVTEQEHSLGEADKLWFPNTPLMKISRNALSRT
jgi:hypothetical protein